MRTDHLTLMMTGHKGKSKMNTSILSNDRLRTIAPSIFAREASPTRSERFRPIATIDAVEALRKESFVPVFARQTQVRDEGKRPFSQHMIRFRHLSKQNKTMLKVGDTFYEIVMRNANDGTSRYILNPGLFRLACSNGMTVPLANLGHIAVKHVGQEVIEKVLEATKQIADMSSIALDAVSTWPKVILSPAQRKAFAKKALNIRFPEESAPVEPVALLAPRRDADKGDDLWRTFNVVQENLMRGGLNYIAEEGGHRRFAQTKAIKAIARDVEINTQLWDVAKSYA